MLLSGFLSSCRAQQAPTQPSYTTPAWFKEGVLYEIFVRSFRDSNGDGIGDLNGITLSLDYLQSLGVTTLWLTPIFPSPSYHGYDVTDYFSVNPDFGTRQDLIDLVNAVHQRGMYILLDYVASHTSDQHANFLDALGNPQSEFADFYLWKDDQHTTYRSYMDFVHMPTVNHGSEQANRYFLDIAKYWMDLNQDGDYTDGIDGWRCDYATGAPEAFWRSMRSELKTLNPDVLLLGEVWVREPSGQSGYFKDAFDAQFDFPLYFALEGDPAISQDGLISGNSIVSLATDRIEAARSLFDPESILVRFINNHDMDRSASEVSADMAREKLGALLLATLDGVPMIYYGEEIGMQGKRGSGPAYDEFRREPMEWAAQLDAPGMTSWFKDHQYIKELDGISVEEQEQDPGSLLNFYRVIYRMRAENPALASGKYMQMQSAPANSNVWAFWRYTDGQLVGVFFNFGEEEAKIAPDTSQAPSETSRSPLELYASGDYSITSDQILLEPGSAVLLDYTP